MRYYVGIDGGGTRTTLGLADGRGAELLRRVGGAGIVDPRRPEASAETLITLVREATAEAGMEGPAAGLCAGLAGVGDPAARDYIRAALVASGVAEQVLIVSDGETALEGAFTGQPGILIISGTGSNSFSRGRDGVIRRAGGWGLVVGDEGSGYWIGKTALQYALQGEDGRGEPTRLMPELMQVLQLSIPNEIPTWAGRAAKAEVASLVPHVMRVAQAGDAVAGRLLDTAAHDLAAHARALLARVDFGATGEVPVALVGGVGKNPTFSARVRAALQAISPRLVLRTPAADAVAGAILLARR